MFIYYREYKGYQNTNNMYRILIKFRKKETYCKTNQFIHNLKR